MIEYVVNIQYSSYYKAPVKTIVADIFSGYYYL